MCFSLCIDLQASLNGTRIVSDIILGDGNVMLKFDSTRPWEALDFRVADGFDMVFQIIGMISSIFYIKYFKQNCSRCM